MRLDTAIGDGDHGTNMDRGMRKAIEKLGRSRSRRIPVRVLKTVAMALVSSVGGAAGPLYGTLLLQMGTAMAGKEDVDLAGYTAAWRKGSRRSPGTRQGRARRQDDGRRPAPRRSQALEQASDLDSGLREAASAAERGMRDTIPLVARKGRASYLGERSKDHQDPGATSTYYLCQTAAEALAG